MEERKKVIFTTNESSFLLVGYTAFDAKKYTRDYNHVKIGADVLLFGYPVVISKIKNRQFDMYKPLLRKGIVAGKYEKNRTILLDCPSYGGNSGGPVFLKVEEQFKDKFYIIGVMSEFMPFYNDNKKDIIMNSGYSVVVPIDYAIELMKKFK